jgi:large subunit ribosomal protein L6
VSRIGRLPIAVPAGVQVELNGTFVKVKGPKGEMQRTFSPLIDLALESGIVTVTRRSDVPTERALHGTTRAVLNNMIRGVSSGFERILEWDGVGYRAEMSGDNLVLHMGYSHPVTMEPPKGISFEVDAKTRQIKVLGFDKEDVGQVASNIRKVRPVEPYLGKGLHYLGEKIRRKAGKSGKAKK